MALVVFLVGPGLVWLVFLATLLRSTGPHVMSVVVTLAIITAMIMIPATIYLLVNAPKTLRLEAAMLRAAFGERPS